MPWSPDSNAGLNFPDPPKAEKLRKGQIAKDLKLKAEEVAISSAVTESHRGLRTELKIHGAVVSRRSQSRKWPGAGRRRKNLWLSFRGP